MSMYGGVGAVQYERGGLSCEIRETLLNGLNRLERQDSQELEMSCKRTCHVMQWRVTWGAQVSTLVTPYQDYKATYILMLKMSKLIAW